MIHDNVVVCPRGQALIAGGIGPISISGNTLTSQGPRRQPKASPIDIISLLAVFGQSVFVINLGRTPGLGSVSSGYTTKTNIHTRAYPTAMVTAAAASTVYPDGRTLFHGNQVTLEILENAPPIVMTCATLISMDDVSIQDNQILTQINGGLVLSSLLAAGVTVRAHANRIHELPLHAFLSYLSLGMLNNGVGNQGTHCIILRGTQVVDSDNQVAITTLCERLQAIFAKDKGAATAVKPKIGAGYYAVKRADILGK
jgi:hypothetical protein